MRDTGKRLNDVKVYTDPECPPDVLYGITIPFTMPPYLKYRKNSDKLDMRYARNKDYVETKETINSLSGTPYFFIGKAPRRSGNLTEVKDED